MFITKRKHEAIVAKQRDHIRYQSGVVTNLRSQVDILTGMLERDANELADFRTKRARANENLRLANEKRKREAANG